MIKVGDRVGMKDPLDEEEGELLAVRGDVAWVHFNGREEPENIAFRSLRKVQDFKVGDRVRHVADWAFQGNGLATVDGIQKSPNGELWAWASFDVNPNLPRTLKAKALELYREEPPFKPGQRVKAKRGSVWYPEAPRGVVLAVQDGQVWGRTDSGKYFTAEVAKLELE